MEISRDISGFAQKKTRLLAQIVEKTYRSILTFGKHVNAIKKHSDLNAGMRSYSSAPSSASKLHEAASSANGALLNAVQRFSYDNVTDVGMETTNDTFTDSPPTNGIVKDVKMAAIDETFADTLSANNNPAQQNEESILEGFSIPLNILLVYDWAEENINPEADSNVLALFGKIVHNDPSDNPLSGTSIIRTMNAQSDATETSAENMEYTDEKMDTN